MPGMSRFGGFAGKAAGYRDEKEIPRQYARRCRDGGGGVPVAVVVSNRNVRRTGVGVFWLEEK